MADASGSFAVSNRREKFGEGRGFPGKAALAPAIVFNPYRLLAAVRPIRALIVEDNPTDRTYLRGILQTLAPRLPMPLSVDEAESVEVAHELLGAGRYDVVVADYHLMGRSTGVEVLARAKALDESCLRFLVTGDARTVVAREALQAGAAHRVLVKSGGAKPIMEELLRQFAGNGRPSP